MAALRRRLRLALLAALIALGSSALAGDLREITSFGSNPGKLRMFSYVPDGLPASAPLVVVLHGCKQEAVSFARAAGFMAQADAGKFALLMPEQRGLPSYLYDVYVFPWVMAWYGANNQNACFNWFRPGDTARDRGEALSIVQMIDTMMSRNRLDRTRVYVVGLSAGGAMTAAMLAAYPERFRGGAIVAGIPYGCADTISEALSCMSPGVDRPPADWRNRVPASSARPVRIAIWQGDADDRVAPRNRQGLVDQWSAVLGVLPTPTRSETAFIVRELFTDAENIARVESVTVKGLGHAFPVTTAAGANCGEPGDSVTDAGVCAAGEILKFWGVGGGS
jgi:poly(hydroxyalkanoate) depolymerase family esterase